MTPFATVEQYVERFGPVDNTAMLEACLEDATAAIQVRPDKAQVDYSDPSDDFAYRLMSVCRSMANRIMPSGSDIPAGVTQASMTAVGFSESMSFTPSYGTPKPLPSELAMLGISGAGTGRVLYPAYGVSDDASA